MDGSSMVSKRIWFLLALVTVAGSVAWRSEPLARLLLSIHPSLCETASGKWASVPSRCITRACYRDHACGHWSAPFSRCSRLRIGDPLAEVYFQLGEPDGGDGGKLWWWASKAGHEKVMALFEDGKLKTLICPKIGAF
jgi:hypothetical protein